MNDEEDEPWYYVCMSDDTFFGVTWHNCDTRRPCNESCMCAVVHGRPLSEVPKDAYKNDTNSRY